MKVFSNDLSFVVTWKPFFLNPTTPEAGIPLIQYLTQKYGPRAGAMAKDGTSPLTKAGLNVVMIITSFLVSNATSNLELPHFKKQSTKTSSN